VNIGSGIAASVPDPFIPTPVVSVSAGQRHHDAPNSGKALKILRLLLKGALPLPINGKNGWITR
jgi:hypothetical protein